MIDGIIRGSGLGGAIVVTLKNAIQKYQEESEKGFKGDNAKVLLQLLNISPAIGSKASKIYGSMQTAIFEKDVIKEMGWSVTRDGKLNVSPVYEATGALVEGTTNIPMSRLVSKVENMSEALDSRNATWQRVASALGWKPYAIGVHNEEQDLIKAGAKVRKKAEGVEKAKITRLENKLKELDMLSNMTTEEYDNYLNIKKLERRLKYLDKKIKDEETRKMLGK
jgi:tRNA(Phe) wybutosine-synthesizing methylase Tyw3